MSCADFGFLCLERNQLWSLDASGVIESDSGRVSGEGIFIVLEGREIRRHLVESASQKAQQPILADFAELWSFSFPTEPLPMTSERLAAALSCPPPESVEDRLLLLPRGVEMALGALSRRAGEVSLRALAQFLFEADWPFAGLVLDALDLDETERRRLGGGERGLRVIESVPVWEDPPRQGAPLGATITALEARDMLRRHLPEDSENRPGQEDYAEAVSAMFSGESQVVRRDGRARLWMLEAGTGIGKTLAYLAPGRLWAERNHTPLWVSTYSRHLQDQIAREIQRFTEPGQVVIRKGRENYLCLLNYDHLASGTLGLPREQRVLLAILARWLTETREGIMVGGDFPHWLEEALEPGLFNALRLKKGECLYSACPHYRRCFIEGAQRRSISAQVIIANHALTLNHALKDRLDYSHLVLDEAHHLFDAADSATRIRLGYREVVELWQWFVGGRRDRWRGQRQGLGDRLGSLTLDEDSRTAFENVQRACGVFGNPDGGEARIVEGTPAGVFERFFVALRGLFVRDEAAQDGYQRELPLDKMRDDTLLTVADTLHESLRRLRKALDGLMKSLRNLLDDSEEPLDSSGVRSVTSLLKSLEEYPLPLLEGWQRLLDVLLEREKADGSIWLERGFYRPPQGRRRVEVGLEMILYDPGAVLNEKIYGHPREAVLLTSARLGLTDSDRRFAELRCGVGHARNDALPEEDDSVIQQVFASPFDYPAQVRFFVVNDVDRRDPVQLHRAMLTLFRASAGGGLGLFTAIRRAQACYQDIHQPLRRAGIRLFGQHNDQIGNVLLAESMRQHRDACLLATDAFRDGVDVIGDSLRLVVLERVPWSRPDIVHRARRQHFAGCQYEDSLVRQRIVQAFGRLIRSSGDWGSFVLLDGSCPGKLIEQLPVAPERVSLAEAARQIDARQRERSARLKK